MCILNISKDLTRRSLYASKYSLYVITFNRDEYKSPEWLSRYLQRAIFCLRMPFGRQYGFNCAMLGTCLKSINNRVLYRAAITVDILAASRCGKRVNTIEYLTTTMGFDLTQFFTKNLQSSVIGGNNLPGFSLH